MSEEEAAELLSIDGHQVRATHPDKAHFPRQAKLSKLDIVRFYLSIAPAALAGIQNRPPGLGATVAESPAGRSARKFNDLKICKEISIYRTRRSPCFEDRSLQDFAIFDRHDGPRMRESTECLNSATNPSLRTIPHD